MKSGPAWHQWLQVGIGYSSRSKQLLCARVAVTAVLWQAWPPSMQASALHFLLCFSKDNRHWVTYSRNYDVSWQPTSQKTPTPLSANPKQHKEGFCRLKNAGQWDIKSTNCRQALIVQVRTDSWRWDIHMAFPKGMILSRRQMRGWSRGLLWWRSTESFIAKWHHPFLLLIRTHFSAPYTAIVTIG